jgi:hypothetical protein
MTIDIISITSDDVVEDYESDISLSLNVRQKREPYGRVLCGVI